MAQVGFTLVASAAEDLCSALVAAVAMVTEAKSVVKETALVLHKDQTTHQRELVTAEALEPALVELVEQALVTLVLLVAVELDGWVTVETSVAQILEAQAVNALEVEMVLVSVVGVAAEAH